MEMLIISNNVILMLFYTYIHLHNISLSNSRRHSANADVKSKIIVSRRHFFADVIFSPTSKVQNYQNKTREKSLNPKKQALTTNCKGFSQIIVAYRMEIACQGCKHQVMFLMFLSVRALAICQIVENTLIPQENTFL